MQQTLAFLGPSGTHSEELARLAFPNRPLAQYPSLADCIQAVADLQIPAALVPIENSLEGAVNITLDLLAQENRLYITNEYVWPICHYLLTVANSEPLHTIYSHPQALAQCRQYLRNQFPTVHLVSMDSTAAAALAVSKNGSGHGAIASKRSAALYNLITSEHSIADQVNNHTRFIMIESRLGTVPTSPNTKTSIVCRMQENKPGSLHFLLSVFAQQNINLVRIESRPARTKLGEYTFFLDMEGSLLDTSIATALRNIRQHCAWFKVLGCYPTTIFLPSFSTLPS